MPVGRFDPFRRHRSNARDVFDRLLTAETDPRRPGGSGPDVDRLLEAIASVESLGSGGYSAVGPADRRGDRPYGRYQVMGANLPEWSQKYAGKRLSPPEFLADTAAQNRVARGRLAELIEKGHSIEDAASIWHSGVPLERAQGRKDVLGTGTPDYVRKVATAYRGPTAAPEADQPDVMDRLLAGPTSRQATIRGTPEPQSRVATVPRTPESPEPPPAALPPPTGLAEAQQAGRALLDIARGVPRGVGGMVGSAGQTLEMASVVRRKAEEAVLPRAIEERLPSREFERFLARDIARAGTAFAQRPEFQVGEGASPVTRFLSEAAETVPQLAAAVAGGAVAGPVGFAAPIFALEGGNAYQEARQRGVSEGNAALVGAIVGTVNTVIESHLGVGVSNVMERVPGARKFLQREIMKRVPARMLTTGAAEGFEEVLQGAANALAQFIASRDPEIWQELKQSLPRQAALGATVGLAFGAGDVGIPGERGQQPLPGAADVGIPGERGQQLLPPDEVQARLDAQEPPRRPAAPAERRRPQSARLRRVVDTLDAQPVGTQVGRFEKAEALAGEDRLNWRDSETGRPVAAVDVAAAVGVDPVLEQFAERAAGRRQEERPGPARRAEPGEPLYGGAVSDEALAALLGGQAPPVEPETGPFDPEAVRTLAATLYGLGASDQEVLDAVRLKYGDAGVETIAQRPQFSRTEVPPEPEIAPQEPPESPAVRPESPGIDREGAEEVPSAPPVQPDVPIEVEAGQGVLARRDESPVPPPFPEGAAPATAPAVTTRLVEVAPSSPAEPASSLARGSETQIIDADGGEVPAHYAVVALEETVTSHDPETFAPNPAFPQVFQGRTLDKDKAAQAEIVKQSERPNANLLLDQTARPTDGPEIMTPSGLLIAGRSRNIIKRRALSRGKLGEYVERVKAEAEAFGIDPAAVDKIVAAGKTPNIVRVLGEDVTDPTALDDLSRRFDLPPTKRMDAAGEAAQRARNLERAQGALAHLNRTLPEDSTVRQYLEQPEGRAFLKALVDDGVISGRELGALVDATTGSATAEGKAFVEGLLQAAAVGDPRVVARAPDSILRKLEHATPAIVSTGQFEAWDIRPILRDALDLLAAVRAGGHSSVDDFVAQQDIFGREFTPAAIDMARFLDEKGKKEVTDSLRAYAHAAASANNALESEDLFGYEPPGPDEARSQHLRESAAAYGRGADHPLNRTKVVDREGKPKVVYHGTPVAFERFDMEKLSESSLYGAGLYFTDDPRIAGGHVQVDAAMEEFDTKEEAERVTRNAPRGFFVHRGATGKWIGYRPRARAVGGGYAFKVPDVARLDDATRARIADVLRNDPAFNHWRSPGYLSRSELRSVEDALTNFEREERSYLGIEWIAGQPYNIDLTGALAKAGGIAPNVRPARLALEDPLDIHRPLDVATAQRIGPVLSQYGSEDFTPRLVEIAERNAKRLSRVQGGVWDTVEEAVRGMFGHMRGGTRWEIWDRLGREAGYDGYIYHGGKATGGKPHVAYVVFDPERVFSAFGEPSQATVVGEQPGFYKTMGEAEAAFGSDERAEQLSLELIEAVGEEFVTTSLGKIATAETRQKRIGKRKAGRAWIDIRGKKLSTREQMFKLLRPFRDPRFERLHYILTDAQGKILSHSMESSGAIDYVTIQRPKRMKSVLEVERPDESMMAGFREELLSRAKRLGATRLYLAHNHPSGDPSPSREDKAFTVDMARTFKDTDLFVMGHLVIDDTRATFITPAGGTGPISLPEGEFGDWTAAHGPAIDSPLAVATAFTGITSPDRLDVAYVSTRNRVVALEPHAASKARSIVDWLPQRIKALGAARAILVVGSRGVQDDAIRAQKAGATMIGPGALRDAPILDIVYVEPSSGASRSAKDAGAIYQTRARRTQRPRRLREEREGYGGSARDPGSLREGAGVEGESVPAPEGEAGVRPDLQAEGLTPESAFRAIFGAGPDLSPEQIPTSDRTDRPALERRISPRSEQGALDLSAEPAATGSSIPEVEARWRAAKGIKRPGLVARVIDGVRGFKDAMRRHFPHLDTKASPKDALSSDILRQWEGSPHWAEATAIDALTQQIGDLTNTQIDLVARNLALPDLLRSVDEGLYEGKDLPFGYPDREAMATDLSRYSAAAVADPAVQEAITRRQEFTRGLTERLVDLGLLGEKALENVDAYYHRQVLEYANEKRGTGTRSKDVRTGKKGFQRARTGGGDFNTAYQEAEFEWVSQALSLIATKEALQRLKQVNDIRPMLVEQARMASERGEEVRWQDLIPDGYMVWQPERGSVFFRSLSIPEAALDRIMEERGHLLPDDLREAVVMGGPREQWVVPENVAETLDNVGGTPRQQVAVERLWRGAIASWKQWVLLNPLRAIKYNLNNSSGDLDIATAYDPRITKYVPKATRDLYRAHSQRADADLQAEILDGIRKGVLGSGFSVMDVPDINKLGVWRALTSDDPNVFQQVGTKYWSGVRNATTMRENILRLASWRYFRDRIAGGENPYGASKAYEVDAIEDPDDRAAKLGRELIGDYGNISAAGEWLRERLFPFYSWMEINAPRYVRIMANAGAEGQGASRGRVAAVAGKRAAVRTGAKLVGLGVKAPLLYLLIQAWNHLMFPDEEKDLRKSGRDPHIILGRYGDGSVRSLRFEGALADALEWLDLQDLPADVRDLQEGDASPADKMAEAVKGPVERGIQSFEPISKTVFELAMGRSTYPTVFKEGADFGTRTRPIRDRGEYAARLVSLDRLYTAVMDKPMRPGSLDPVTALVTYRTEPGEAAYWDAKQIVSDWRREERGIEMGDFSPTERSNALYYHKKAVQWGQTERAQRWLDRYFELGGSQGGLKQSLAQSAPLGALAKKDQPDFLASLTADERATVRQAEEWYNRVYRPGDGSTEPSGTVQRRPAARRPVQRRAVTP